MRSAAAARRTVASILHMPNDDALAVIEQAYVIQASEDAWLTAIATPIGRALELRDGAAAAFVEYIPSRKSNAKQFHGYDGCDPRMVTFTAYMHSLEQSPEMLDAAYGQGSTLTGTLEHLGARFGEQFTDATHIAGVPDAVTFLCLDALGLGVVFVHPVRSRASISPRKRALWSQVAAHVCAGLRLQRAALAAAAPTIDATAAAIVTPDGKIEHLAASAQQDADVFRDAVRRIDQAKLADTRSNPEAALDLWACLFSGEYSVVDRFDSDGKRFFVAKRNSPDARGPRALTLRERQVVSLCALGRAHKVVAYELGIAEGTVANYLHEGLRKLGVPNLTDLALLANALEQKS